VHRDDRADFPQFDQDARDAEVAGMDDQIRCAQRLQTGLGRTAIAARQVRVGDQGELDQRRG